MDKIYYYEWKGIHTTWEYRVEFTPASESPIDANPTYYRLPIGSFEPTNRKKSLDKYPFGLAEGCTFDFKIYLSEIPDNAEYKEFFECIINPIKVVNIPIPFIYDGVSKAINIENVQLGTIVTLKSRYADSNPINWSQIPHDFAGCIKENNNIKLNVVQGLAEMTAIDINKCVLTSFNFSMLSDYDQQASVNGFIDKPNRNNVFPFVVSCFGNKEGFDETVIASRGETKITNNDPITVEHGLEYHFAKFNIIQNYIDYVGKFVYNSLMRLDEQQPIYPLSLLCNVYQQVPNTTGEKGQQSLLDDLYILSYVISNIYIDNTHERVVIGGLFANNLDIGLNQRYPNSIWDYMKDYSESFLIRFDPTYLSSNRNDFQRIFHTPNKTYTLKMNDLISMDIEMNKNILKKVTSSLPERHQGGDFTDTDKYEFTKLGTRNESEYTIPITFYTNPLHIVYKRNEDDFKDVIFHSNPQILHCGLYRIHQAGTLSAYDQLNNGNKFPVLMHENMDIWLGDGDESNKNPNIYPTQATIAKYYREAERVNVGPSELIYTIQNSENAGGYPRYVAKLLLNIYGNDNQHEITIEVNYDKFLEVPENMTNGFHWWNLNSVYQIDWTSFGSYWGTQYKYWRPISIELDDSKEVVKLILYPETSVKDGE